MRDRSSKVILASRSTTRRQLLERAGVSVQLVAPEVDERSVESGLNGVLADGARVAVALAAAKAVAVSALHPEALVIGADQTLRLHETPLHKPDSPAAARVQLLQLSGQTHHLHSGVVLARRGETLWSHVATAALTMRQLWPAAIDRYLEAVGEAATASVGAYQIEGRGIRLFERIDGDYFTILGLPLLPLLAALRDAGALGDD